MLAPSPASATPTVCRYGCNGLDRHQCQRVGTAVPFAFHFPVETNMRSDYEIAWDPKVTELVRSQARVTPDEIHARIENELRAAEHERLRAWAQKEAPQIPPRG
jgi:hypothetical protein